MIMIVLRLAKKYFFVVLLLAVVPLWLNVFAPEVTKLPANFSYEADLLSMDNLFDAKMNKFSGATRSVAKFSYSVSGKHEGAYLILGTFAVRKITGEKIISLQRTYAIDPKTGRHLVGLGDHDRDGYLFAPRHLEKGQSFDYWHINYDAPAHLQFIDEELIDGVKVFRYETRYEGQAIDQTENLKFLPGVGVTKGVRLEPYLQLWIEPISGYLVKYKDDTVAYFTDLKTGKKLDPWNHFTNEYTHETVKNHLQKAVQLKKSIIIAEDIVPLILLFLILLVVLYPHRRSGRSHVIIFIAFVTTAFFCWQFLSPAHFAETPSSSGPQKAIRLGAQDGLLPISVWVAEHRGYFKDQGLVVSIKKFSSGRAAIESMFTNGDSDLVTVAQTPIVLHSFQRDDFSIIAGMVSASNDTKILARKDRNIASALDLRGKRIGATKRSSGHYFLGIFLAKNGLTFRDITMVDLEASDLLQAIAEGRVDAISTWEPHIDGARKMLGKNGLLLESRGTYREDFYFAGMKNWIRSDPDRVRRFLRAIDQADTYIADHPEESQRIVADKLQLDLSYVEQVWKEYDVGLFLDQAVLLSFEQQARWMISNHFIDSAPVNYLNFLEVDPLADVKPQSVTIIR